MSRYEYFQQLKEDLKGSFKHTETKNIGQNIPNLMTSIKAGLKELDMALDKLTITEESL